MSLSFWKNIKAYKDFNASFDILNYVEFCPSWHVFIADIEGSTQAIEAGKYKDVNLIGAMSIVAVINACKDIEIPFVFGGDGASILVPDAYVEKAKSALLATKKKARQQFDLQLRVGSISVRALHDKNITLYIAKHEISPHYKQAVFYGGGMSAADDLIKHDLSYCYEEPDTLKEVDFTGLECRWQDIPSSKEETISLLVYAEKTETYKNLLAVMTEIMGHYAQRNPAQPDNLNLSFSLPQLMHESNAKATRLSRYTKVFKLYFENVLAWLLIYFKITLGETSWGEYKQQVQLTTDSEKFDDTLRMTCAIHGHERHQLEIYLQKQYNENKLCYGIHISDRALMTCLVFERMGNQVHFIDAADGGYAMAAIGLKKQLKQRSKN